MESIYLLLILLSFLIDTAAQVDEKMCMSAFFSGTQFKDNAVPYETKQAGDFAVCTEGCKANDACVAIGHLNGQCQFFKLETGKNLNIGWSDICNNIVGIVYVKLYIPSSAECNPVRLVEFWYGNTTKKLTTGQSYQFKEVDDKTYQITAL